MYRMRIKQIPDRYGLMREARVDVLRRSGTKLRVWLMKHYGCGLIDHMCLEHHFVQLSIPLQTVSLRLGQLKPPIREERVDFRKAIVFRPENRKFSQEFS